MSTSSTDLESKIREIALAEFYADMGHSDFTPSDNGLHQAGYWQRAEEEVKESTCNLCHCFAEDDEIVKNEAGTFHQTCITD